MRRSPLLLTITPLLLLAACSSKAPEPAPVDNDVEMLDVTNEATVVPEAPLATPTPTPTPVLENTSAPVSADEQVQADAEAAGMTSRVNRDEAATPEEQPVEEKKD